MLSLSTMEKPPYFENIMPWDSWKVTFSSIEGNTVMFGFQKFMTSQSKSLINAHYPGFTNAMDVLAAMGCDNYFVTSVLKHCILHSENQSLHTFLSSSQTIKQVEQALAVGLTWDEYIETLSVASPVVHSDTLPTDLF